MSVRDELGVSHRSPMVSVIIATYQRRELVKRAVASVLAQTYRDFELIVIDDGSADGTREALAPLCDRLRYEWQPNRGVSAARNAGIVLAAGSIVAFLDSDNRWLPEHLARLVDALEQHPEAVLAFSPWVSAPKPGAPSDLAHLMEPLPLLLVGNYVSHVSAAVVRRTALEDVGGFNERLKLAEDNDLWLRLAVRGGPFASIPQQTLIKGVTPGSLITGRKPGAYVDALEVSTSDVIAELERAADPTMKELLPRAGGRKRFLDALRALDEDDDERARHALADACRLLPELARRPEAVMNHLRFNLAGDDRRGWARQLATIARLWPNRSPEAGGVLMAHALLSTVVVARPIEVAKLLRRLPPYASRDFFLRILPSCFREMNGTASWRAVGGAAGSAGRNVTQHLAWRAHRVLLRSGQGPVRPLWRLAHEALARVVASVLRGSDRTTTTAYVRGSLGEGEPVFGVSDIDLVVVVEGDGSATSARVTRRWMRLTERLPTLSRAMFEPPRVYTEGELLAESRATTLTHGLDPETGREAAVAPSSRERAREHGGAERPYLYGLTDGWRPIGGWDRRPVARPDSRAERRIRAWMELQFWWLQAFRGCAEPDAPWAPYLCVKLVTEPARIWLWLVHGEQVRKRSTLVERALEELPEEEPALRAAGELYRELGRSPAAPLTEALRGLSRMSGRIARRLEAEIERAERTEVRLLGAGDPDVVVPDGSVAALSGAVGPGQPLELKPLADWRARVWSLPPDEAFALVADDPSDVVCLGAAALRSNDGVYAAWRSEQVLILPSLKRARLRGVQCPPTDPVSFALVEGSSSASFPEVPGWSASDSARRAAAEHLGWLGAGGDETEPSVEALGRLLTAARAALFVESIEDRRPELALTVAAAADRLDESVGGSSTLAREAYESYRRGRLEGEPPAPDIVAALRRVVERMQAYGGGDRSASG